MGFRSLDVEQIRAALAAWRLDRPVRVEPLESDGMNSECWSVAAGAGRFVAKAARDASFRGGLAVAELLESRGFPTGAPLRTRDGELAVPVGAGDFALALLRFFPGRQRDAEGADDLRLWGDVMGRFHSILADVVAPPAGLPRWPRGFLRPDAPFLDREAWVRPAVAEALAGVRALDPLRHGIVHGDAAFPFIDDASGRVAVIDWGAAMWGPLLYDVASARFYFQFRGNPQPAEFEPFLAAYLASGPLQAEEVQRGPEAFVRLRVAVQASYFSWRLERDVRLGLDDPAENQQGLDGARLAWGVLRAS